jgi:flagellar hook-length control protein FliK
MPANALPPVSSPTPTALVAPPPPTAGGSDAGSFSRLLEAADARRMVNPTEKSLIEPDTRTPTTAAKPWGTGQKSPPREPARAERGDRAERANGANGTPSTNGTNGADGSRPAQETAASEEAGAEEAAEKAGRETPADAASLLAGLGLLGQPRAPADGSGVRSRVHPGLAGRAGSDAAGAAEGLLGGKGAAGLAGAAGSALAADDATGAANAKNAANAANAAGGFAGLLAAAQGGEARAEASALANPATALPTPAAAEARSADLGALGSLLQPGATAGALPGQSAALPAEARLPASPGTPAFADELGAQLSTFVKEGVQHARLELNPKEMGPVTVQIQLNGGSAHLSFAAEHAQTRQALEQALPTLAGNLREAGLTLSGGGVFEQAPQPQPQAQRDAEGGSGRGQGRGGQGGSEGPDAGALAAPGQPAPRRRGVVDLVA